MTQPTHETPRGPSVRTPDAPSGPTEELLDLATAPLIAGAHAAEIARATAAARAVIDGLARHPADGHPLALAPTARPARQQGGRGLKDGETTPRRLPLGRPSIPHAAPGATGHTTTPNLTSPALSTRQFVQADSAVHLHLIVGFIGQGCATAAAVDAAMAAHILVHRADAAFGKDPRQTDYYQSAAVELGLVARPMGRSRRRLWTLTPTGLAWAATGRNTPDWRVGLADACRSQTVFGAALDLVKANPAGLTCEAFDAALAALYDTAQGRRRGTAGAGGRRGKSVRGLLVSAGLLDERQNHLTPPVTGAASAPRRPIRSRPATRQTAP